MMKKFPRTLLATALATAWAPGVFAQALEEIVVVAERRSVNIQEVAISVQAFSAEFLSDAVVTQPIQLGEITPGLQYSKQTGQANPYIRGIGTQNTAVGDESTVATYVDGVYIMGMQAAATSFNNIERIEVLKGPQGTLFGRNTTGGLIHIITKDPSHEPQLRLGLDYDDYDTITTNLYGSMSVSDKVATDLAIFYSDQGDGYGTNKVTGEDVNLTKDQVLRNKWLIEPSEDLKIVLTFDYAKTKTDIASARGPIKGAVGIDGALVFQGCMAESGDPAGCTALAQQLGTTYSGDHQDIQANRQSPSEAEQKGAAAHLRYSMDNFDIVSITSYRQTDVDALLVQDGIAPQVLDATLDREEEQFTQEIQFVSNGEGRLSWIVGGFYMDSEAKYTPFVLDGPGLGLLAPGVTLLEETVTQTLESYSLFAQGTYSISDALRLTLGGRWTYDKRELEGTTSISFGPTVLPIPFQDDEDWDEPTWRVALDYDVSDDMMIYASYNRGFKSGVYNSIVSSGTPQPAVEPEIVNAYEIGMKSEWLESRLRANLAVFYYDYQDIQLQFVNAGATILGNASDAEITGGELELFGAVTENLSVRFGAAFLDTEYKKYTGAPISTPNDAGFGPFGGNAVSFGDVSGNNMARAPEYTTSLGLNYSQAVGGDMVFAANLNWYYNDGFYWFEDNRVKQDAYDVVNAELSLSSSDDRWKVRLWAKNLTDEEYSIFTNSGQFGDLEAAAPPRVVGAGVEYRFF